MNQPVFFRVLIANSFFMESYPGGGFLTIILVFEPYKRRPFSSQSNGHLGSRCTYMTCIFFPLNV